MGFKDFVEKSAGNMGIEIPNQRPIIGDYQDDFSNDFTELKKSKTWPLLTNMLRGLDVVPQDGDYKAFAQVYSAVLWVYVAAYIIGTSIGSLPVQICSGKKDNPNVIEEGPVFDLFENPNEYDGLPEMVEDTAIDLELTGNGYWEKYGSVGNLPINMYSIDPVPITIKEDAIRKIAFYKYKLADGSSKTFYPEQLAHFKYANPTSEFYGMSAIKPLQTSLVTELHRQTYTKSYFENEARPDLIMTHNADISKGVGPMSEGMKKRFAQTWRQSFGGPKRKRLPVLLDSGMDVRILSEARRDMDFAEMEKSIMKRVFAGYGVPQVLACMFDDVNYSTAKEQVRIFWRVTLPPKVSRIAGTITRSILRPYDKKLWCKFDMSDISALEETVKEREERLSRMFERAGITLGEYRHRMGFKVEKDDPYQKMRFITANLLPLDAVLAPPVDEGEGGELLPENGQPAPGTGGPPPTSPRGFPGDDLEGEEA